MTPATAGAAGTAGAGASRPVLVRWPGPCWVLLVAAEEDVEAVETHHRDRAGAQADLDDRLVELLVEDLDDALATLDAVDAVDQGTGTDGPGRTAGGYGRSLVDVVTDTPRRGQDAASRLGAAVIYQRPGCCWGLVCGRCERPRDLNDLNDLDNPGDTDADAVGVWTHVDDHAAAVGALAELGAVCADCAAAAALGSVADPSGALLPDPPTVPNPLTCPTSLTCPTFLTCPTSLASLSPWPAWAAARLF